MKYLLLVFALMFSLMATSQIKQHVQINLDSLTDYSEFLMMDEALKDQQIVLTGENHNYRKQNLPLSFKFFRYLHEKHNFDTYVMEFGEGVEWLIQKYIYENDSSTFEIMKQSYFTEQLALIENLKEYYDAQ
ncbi:MAG: hypothetical protein JKY54_13265 [Flavobacteriales bacterium]|nr:hypothetical protein [Flavobacteriales bacterium]